MTPPDIPSVVSLLLGFVSAWLLFEVTEWRRVRLARRELTTALVAELEHAEAVVSNIVMKYTQVFLDEDDTRLIANEIRWFYDVGRQRLQDVGILSELPPGLPDLKTLSDHQLVAAFRPIRETLGTKIILPVVEGVLIGQILGFNKGQIRSLSMVRWQAYLLEQDVDLMKEMFRLTYTVTDENNHKTVLENHKQRRISYAKRAKTLLLAIRTALQQLS